MWHTAVGLVTTSSPAYGTLQGAMLVSLQRVAIGFTLGAAAGVLLVSFYIGHGSSTWAAVRAAGGFAVNLMGHGQETLAGTFARKGATGSARPPGGGPARRDCRC